MARLLTTARWAAIACGLLAIYGFVAIADAQARGQASANPSFSTTPSLDRGFAWRIRDYVIRCDQDPVQVHLSVPTGWQGKVGRGPFRSNSFTASRAMTAGGALRVTFHRLGRATYDHFHVRCLPPDFPRYHFGRTGKGGPGFFIVQLTNNYAAIFNHNGVPVWWYKASTPTFGAQLLPDGTLAWDRYAGGGTSGGPFEIRSLAGQLIRTVGAAGGLATDIHELQLLPNGNYLIGTIIRKPHQDTSPYGGPSDATVNTYEIQELTPDGQRVWRWDSLKHIGLNQTPQRWWDQVLGGGQPSLDIQHFNAAEPDGKYLLLSFRHLDAIYKINRNTGGIVWKLGGTHTSKSLKVLKDPEGSYPLGGQHDVRLLPDGTISIYDNFTNLPPRPRVVRYRINEKAKTATLVQSFEDRTATTSPCCGSARMLPSGDWLVSWGGLKFTGGYNSKGRSVFRLQYPGGFSYRSFPVPPGALTASQLREAMNAMQH